ncbi:MAG: TonB-dependent receptor [Rhodocyclaceae bacterium]|nr:TonB-dependent receptor [Rhodocyclaceae bacterium]
MSIAARYREIYRSALGAAAIALSICAFAAEAPSSTDENTVVVISATRTKQLASDLPVSIDRISDDTLRDGKLQVNLSEAISRVPGINAENRQNYAQDLQVSSRGFGARASFGVRGIRLYADGIPATMPDGQGQVAHFDLSSAESLEIMRGPFSVLYGNAAGGVISLMTENGGPDTALDASIAFGSFGTTRVAAKMSGITPAFNYVASGSRFRSDGYRDHSSAERETLNVKLSATPWQGSNLILVANDLAMPNAEDPLGLTRSQMESNPTQAGNNALLYNARKSVKQQQGGFTLSAPVGADDTPSVAVYFGKRDAIQFQSIAAAAQSATTHPGGVIDLSRDYSGVDLRWSHQSAQLPLSATFGVSQDDLNETRRGYQNFIGGVLGIQGALRRDEENNVTARDAYAQVQWKSLSGFNIFGGIRYSRILIDSNDHYIVAGNGNDSGSTAFSATTPVLGINYRATPEINLYLSSGRGFETPTLNELSYQPSGAAGLNFALQAARSRHLESGIKWRPNGAMSLNLAVFQVDTDNEIAIATNAAGRSSFRNVGRTERSGVELAAQARLANGFGAALAYTHLSARYLDAATGVSPATAIVIGNQMPGIPSTSAYAEITWRHAASGFNAAIEARHVGRVFVNDGNTDATSAYGIANLRCGFEQRTGRLLFKEFFRIDNLNNRRYVATVIVNESLGRYFEPAPGRNYLIGASARYVF